MKAAFVGLLIHKYPIVAASGSSPNLVLRIRIGVWTTIMAALILHDAVSQGNKIATSSFDNIEIVVDKTADKFVKTADKFVVTSDKFVKAVGDFTLILGIFYFMKSVSLALNMGKNEKC